MSTTHLQEASPSLATRSILLIDQAVDRNGLMTLNNSHRDPKTTKQPTTGASLGLLLTERHPNRFLIWKARTA